MTDTLAPTARPGAPARPPSGPGPRRGRPVRWRAAVTVALVVAAAVRAGAPTGLLNPRGLPQLGDLAAAALGPETDPTFLAIVGREALTTLAFAVLGTALALGLGVVGAPLLSSRWWSGPSGRRPGAGWVACRVGAVVPRSLHEVVWGLVLLNVLGLDPLVAVLAIGLPFGAVTAKVFADVVDAADGTAHDALLAAGAGRTAAIAWGVVPAVGADLASYAWYRFECAIRAAAVLGFVGAGGLGFQLQLSFASLRWEEVWTVLWALVVLDGAAELVASRVRRRIGFGPDGRRRGRAPSVGSLRPAPRRTAPLAGLVVVAAVAASWRWVGLDPTTPFAPRARRLAGDLAARALPPVAPDGPAALAGAALDTVAVAVLAVLLAAGIGGAVAVLVGPGRPRRLRSAAGVTGIVVRSLLLVARAVPPPVWAVAVLFVVRPGPWAAAVALGAYNLGVLGRLLLEAVEDAEPTARQALVAAGATSVAATAHATLPAVAGRAADLTIHRWEVAARDAVVVGVVGAGGLGRDLDEALSSFAWDHVAAVVLALAAVTVAVDLAGAALRPPARAGRAARGTRAGSGLRRRGRSDGPSGPGARAPARPHRA